jgi:hypothetical protein
MSRSTFRKSLPLSLLVSGLILNLWLTGKVIAETQEEKDSKKASQQATQVAKQTAEAQKKMSEQATQTAKKAAENEKKFQEQRKNAQKEIQINGDPKAGPAWWDCHLRWVKHQDPFGITGIDGDVALQFKVQTQVKNGRVVPVKTIMTITFYSEGEKHKNDNGGVITVDGNPITFTDNIGYHTDTPWGITDPKFRLEVIDYPIFYDDFVALATGTNVRGNMGGIEFEVKDFNQFVFREMAEETQPTTAPNTGGKKKKPTSK